MINFVNSLSSQELLNILLLSHDATAIYTGEELTIRLANDAMLSIWGKDIRVRGMRFEDALPEMKGQPFTELLKNVWRTGETYRAKDTPADIVVDGKLQTFYFDFTYSAIRDEQGKIFCVLHTATEVSDRMNAWREVRHREETEHRINEELAAANEEYQSINEELNVRNEELASLNEEYTAVNEELNATNEELLAVRQELEHTVTQLAESNVVLNLENVALSLAERKALALFEDAPVAIGLLNGEDLNITSANKELLELWGRSSDILGKPLDQVLPELKGQSFLGLLTDVLKSGKPYFGNEEKVFLVRDGKMGICYFNFVYKPVRGQNSKTHSIMIVANEVTAQVEARKSIEESNERYILALNAGQLGSYDLDIASGRMSCSDQCKRNFGMKPEDRLDFEDLLHAISPEYKEYVQQQVSTAIAQNQIYEAEYEIRWPDGTRRWIHATGRPRYDQFGKPFRIVGVTQDITERKAYEQRKDDFLGIASHELKTPITVLKANLQLLDRFKLKLNDQMAIRLIDNASGSMNKITTLIEDLLNISKQSEGKLDLNKAQFDLNELLGSCCNHIRMEGKYQLHIDAEHPLPVFADEHRIEQVLVNFVNNAVKYASESFDIYLSAKRLPQHIKVSVKDLGKGIPEEQLPHLFDRYWQANNTTDKYTGLGLGLFICSEIIKRHGGEIGAESELGKGSTFWFTLPLALD